MLNTTLWWLLLIPLLMSVASFFVLQKVGGQDAKESAIFSLGGLLVSALIVSIAFYMGKGSKTHDVEIWNGQITGKTRVHDSYVRSYSCNCRQQCSGSGQNQSCTTVCDTCYEDHYTVTWKAQSTIGEYDIEHEDSTSQSIYKKPDSPFFMQIKPGEACAKEHNYTNYIKAVPESLFRPAAESLKEQFKNLIPSYPGSIYNFWHIDRVIGMGLSIPNLNEWNVKLSNELRTLGPTKQANAIIVFVNTADPNYAYALQDAWVNGKKNDIILIVGATKFPNKADWVHVLALTDAEMFKIKLRDDVMALDELTPDNVIQALSKNTQQYFVRKSMKDFAYLDAEIDPPTWVNVTAASATILAYLGFWFWVYHENNSHRSKFSRRRF